MEWLSYYFLPPVVIIIVWLLHRTFRTKRNIEQTVEKTVENNQVFKSDTNLMEIDGNPLELETKNVNDIQLIHSKDVEDFISISTSSSEYIESESNLSSFICRHECTENGMQDMSLTSSKNDETDGSSNNTSTSEYFFVDTLSTLPSEIYSIDNSKNEINDMVDMELICSKNEDVNFSKITSTLSSENIGSSSFDNIGSSSTIPSLYDSNDFSENDIQYVEDFSDVGLYSTASDGSDIDDNMNNGFIEIEEIIETKDI